MKNTMKVQLLVSCLTIFQFGTVWAQDVSNPCELPFTKMIDKNTGMPFQLKDAVNTNDRIADVNQAKYNYKHRFLVANLDTKDEAGQCKGLVEKYPKVEAHNVPVDQYPELKDEETLRHFLGEVQPHYQTPANKNSIVNVKGTNYCIGQTISLCEIRSGKPVEIARLGTSSLSSNSAPARERTYGEYNQISFRRWMQGRSYTSEDGDRDAELGGVDAENLKGMRYTRYTSGGNMVLNNFMKWDGYPGYEVPNFYGGLHELSIGETNVNNLGAPVSHGCLRLSRYGSIFARWWTPLEAKMFVYYTKNGYRQRP